MSGSAEVHDPVVIGNDGEGSEGRTRSEALEDTSGTPDECAVDIKFDEKFVYRSVDIAGSERSMLGRVRMQGLSCTEHVEATGCGITADSRNG